MKRYRCGKCNELLPPTEPDKPARRVLAESAGQSITLIIVCPKCGAINKIKVTK